ncbi:MAG: GGDEF domain-containing protein [Clostridia bacterium]|nr:GGDEF domain-containing protein [Clostridia bacterium]
MSDFYIYYIESNIVCFIIFAIMLVHDFLHIDRQESQVKYDNALAAFMLYFLSDCVWAAVQGGLLPKSTFSVVATHFANCLLMGAVTYFWLRYVMAMEQVPNREKRTNRLAVLLPFIISTLALAVTYIAAPQVLIDENLEVQDVFGLFLITVPYIYIGAVLIYSLRRARTEKNPLEKRKHIFLGLFPFIVTLGGMVEMIFFPHMPIFCFCCSMLMLVFYLQSMDRQISTDPLTRLNNRGQLVQYVSQESNLRREGRETYVMMTDINDFKIVNDTWGHSEGDNALKLVAEALRETLNSCGFPAFVARYGGDEFIAVLHPSEEKEAYDLIERIRAAVAETCKKNATPYKLSVGIGCDRLLPSPDNFAQCQVRADHKLYLDKELCKLTERTEA